MEVVDGDSVPARGRPVPEKVVGEDTFADGVMAPESAVPVSLTKPEAANPLPPCETMTVEYAVEKILSVPDLGAPVKAGEDVFTDGVAAPEIAVPDSKTEPEAANPLPPTET